MLRWMQHRYCDTLNRAYFDLIFRVQNSPIDWNIGIQALGRAFQNCQHHADRLTCYYVIALSNRRHQVSQFVGDLKQPMTSFPLRMIREQYCSQSTFVPDRLYGQTLNRHGSRNARPMHSISPNQTAEICRLELLTSNKNHSTSQFAIFFFLVSRMQVYLCASELWLLR